jgi:photosystem II stability/assembly factor-like uncharacterized protein
VILRVAVRTLSAALALALSAALAGEEPAPPPQPPQPPAPPTTPATPAAPAPEALAPPVVPADGKWTRVDAGIKTDLLAVHFPTAEQGWAVGRGGAVLASADGGKTWARQESGLAKADLYAVHFLDAEHGMACGDIGDGPQTGGHVLMGGGREQTAAAIITTTDGGKTWKTSWAPTNFILTGIRMLDKETACAVSHGGKQHADGDTLPGSEDGAKWKTRRAFRALSALCFVDAKLGFAVGTPVSVGFFPPPNDPLFLKKSCRIVRTDDGGRSWVPLEHPDLGGNELMGVSFADAKVGWACGSGGTILRTEDGGDTWVRQEAGFAKHLRDVFAVDARRAWAVGPEGAVLRTVDAGKTWVRVESGATAALRRVWFTSPEHGVAVGMEGTVIRWEGKAAEKPPAP